MTSSPQQHGINMHRVHIALGGNLGDVGAAFTTARTAIAALPNTSIVASSSRYRTPPIGPAGQPDYLNAVIAIDTTMAPLALLDALQQIETAHGRERREHWGARTLDLDIVTIDETAIDDSRLIVPHPHMQDRQFVLRPLCDLAPDWHHPHTGKSAADMLAALITGGESPLAEGETW